MKLWVWSILFSTCVFARSIDPTGYCRDILEGMTVRRPAPAKIHRDRFPEYVARYAMEAQPAVRFALENAQRLPHLVIEQGILSSFARAVQTVHQGGEKEIVVVGAGENPGSGRFFSRILYEAILQGRIPVPGDVDLIFYPTAFRLGESSFRDYPAVIVDDVTFSGSRIVHDSCYLCEPRAIAVGAHTEYAKGEIELQTPLFSARRVSSIEERFAELPEKQREVLNEPIGAMGIMAEKTSAEDLIFEQAVRRLKGTSLAYPKRTFKEIKENEHPSHMHQILMDPSDVFFVLDTVIPDNTPLKGVLYQGYHPTTSDGGLVEFVGHDLTVRTPLIEVDPNPYPRE